MVALARCTCHNRCHRVEPEREAFKISSCVLDMARISRHLGDSQRAIRVAHNIGFRQLFHNPVAFFSYYMINGEFKSFKFLTARAYEKRTREEDAKAANGARDSARQSTTHVRSVIC